MKIHDHARILVLILCCGVAGLILFKSGAGRRPEPMPMASWTGNTMGTTYEVQVAGVEMSDEEIDALSRLVDEELVAVNAAMSTYIPESEISRFNRSREIGRPFPISERFAEVMARAVEIYEATEGAFDPTLGPLIDLWGFGAGSTGDGTPTEEEIQELLVRMGLDRFELSPAGITKNQPELEINLSAIAKGYAVDRVHRLLEQEGFEHLYVEIGGELRCSGLNGAGVSWRIGIQMPERDASASFVRVVRLENRSLATSGDYRNFMGESDQHRHHILDPRTGWPAGHTLASVSVLAEDCMTADAVATALYVMGAEEGMEWLSSRPELDALFIDRHEEGFRFTSTPGFEETLVPVP